MALDFSLGIQVEENTREIGRETRPALVKKITRTDFLTQASNKRAARLFRC
jgi:hypothetical protein